jgi:hypothetical protein
MTGELLGGGDAGEIGESLLERRAAHFFAVEEHADDFAEEVVPPALGRFVPPIRY